MRQQCVTMTKISVCSLSYEKGTRSQVRAVGHFLPFLSFPRSIFSAKDRETNVIVSIGGCQQLQHSICYTMAANSWSAWV